MYTISYKNQIVCESTDREFCIGYTLGFVEGLNVFQNLWQDRFNTEIENFFAGGYPSLHLTDDLVLERQMLEIKVLNPISKETIFSDTLAFDFNINNNSEGTYLKALQQYLTNLLVEKLSSSWYSDVKQVMPNITQYNKREIENFLKLFFLNYDMIEYLLVPDNKKLYIGYNVLAETEDYNWIKTFKKYKQDKSFEPIIIVE